MFLKVLVTLGFSLNFILAVRTEETVIKHKLAKDFKGNEKQFKLSGI